MAEPHAGEDEERRREQPRRVSRTGRAETQHAAQIAEIVATINRTAPKTRCGWCRIVAAGMLLSFKRTRVDTETVLEKYNASFLEMVRGLENAPPSNKATHPPPRRWIGARPSRCSLFPGNGSLTNLPYSAVCPAERTRHP